MKDMTAEIKRNVWTVWGIEIGNTNASFENCYITDKDLTEKEVIQTIQSDYMEQGFVITSARLDEQEIIRVDLLNKTIID